MIHSHKEIINPPQKSKNIGYILLSRSLDPEQDLRILKSSLSLFFGAFGQNAAVYCNDNYIFSILIPECLPKLDLFSFYKRQNDFAFIEGTFYDRELLKKYGKSREDFVRWLLKKLSEKNVDILKKLNGNYSGIIYTSSNGNLYAFNDKFGINKQFFYSDRNQFALTNNIFALGKNPHLNNRIKPESLFQILQTDYPINRNTEFEQIHHILPSEILIRKNDCLFRPIDCYRFERRNNTNTADKKILQNLYEKLDSFFQFLNDYLEEPCGLFLSRGKDARILLNFLDKHFAEYGLFNFRTASWARIEAIDVEKIANRLKKDLLRLEEFTLDRNESVLAGMNTTAASDWFALSQLASKYTNYALIGHGGDKPSGKCAAFREYPPPKTKAELAEAYFRSASKGVKKEDIHRTLPCFKSFGSAKDKFLSTYDHLQADHLCDIEIKHSIENRWFRHTIPILHKANQYITPIYPYLEKNTCQAYFDLPLHLIHSQSAHANLACMGSKTNSIQSTEFPVPLNLERRIRPIMKKVIQLNNLLSGLLFDLKTKAPSNPKISNGKRKYKVLSSYLKERAGGVVYSENNTLLHRVMVIDSYLQLLFDLDFSIYCNPIKSLEFPADSSESKAYGDYGAGFFSQNSNKKPGVYENTRQ